MAAIDVSACMMSYRGELAHKSLVHQYAAFDVAPKSLEVSDRAFAFVTPDVDDSRGTLTLDCHRGGRIWTAGIARCEGAGGCEATRHDPDGLAADVSVSPTGQPVTADPTQDPAHWSTCWFSAHASGGAEQEFASTADVGCTGGLHGDTATLSMSWAPLKATRSALRVTDVSALDIGKEFPGELELTIGSDVWRALPGGCRITLTRAELDTAFLPSQIYVVQGIGACADPLSPSPSNQRLPLIVDPFQFRAGVSVSP
jgi:hypothetical protein